MQKPEPNDSGFPCSGDRTILHFISDGPRGGALLRKAQTAARSYFFIVLTFIQAKLDSVLSNKKASHF